MGAPIECAEQPIEMPRTSGDEVSKSMGKACGVEPSAARPHGSRPGDAVWQMTKLAAMPWSSIAANHAATDLMSSMIAQRRTGEATEPFDGRYEHNVSSRARPKSPEKQMTRLCGQPGSHVRAARLSDPSESVSANFR